VSFVIIYRKQYDRENGVYMMFFLGWNFVSGFIYTLKSKKDLREILQT